jgi:hypothetical protein
MGKPAAGRAVRTLAVGGCALALLAMPCSSMACGHSAAAIARSAATVASRPKPPLNGAGIRVVSVIGSGCPLGSVTIHPLPDLAGFVATYTGFRAEVSSGKILNFRKNCQFGVRMQAPPGYAYTTVSALYVGRGMLAGGTRGMQLTSYYFQGQPQTVSKSHPMSGPFSGTWRHTERLTLSALGNAACGQIRILNINAQLIVYPGASVPGPANYLSLDGGDRGYTTYRFNRTRCP